jgi:hypothetical protein
MTYALLKTAAIGLALSTVTFAAPALAHHSYGMFDPMKTITITGTVKTFEWTNPHIHLWLNADADGAKAGTQPVLWIFEWGSPGTERRQGWTKDTLRVGDKVTVTGHPVRSGQHAGQLQSVSMNGKPVAHLRNKTATEQPGLD